ncbi:MAG: hypothetical protein HYY98_07375 [Burkholderiales bacterium]|jgi:hypothetical protein|nr:hypothetical protein [Burkholderiales bacterium]
MSGFVRKILIFITGYAWLLVLLGPGLIGMSIYSGWKADGDHAFTAKEQLTTVTGKVVEASEVTVKRRRRATKHYYQINVQPASGAEVQKLRIDFSTPKALVASMIDENVTALADMGDNELVYEIAVDGKPLITYDETQQRLLAEAKSSAASMSGAGLWGLAIVLTLVGAAGVWMNRRLRAADEEAEPAAA